MFFRKKEKEFVGVVPYEKTMDVAHLLDKCEDYKNQTVNNVRLWRELSSIFPKLGRSEEVNRTDCYCYYSCGCIKITVSAEDYSESPFD